MTTFLHRLKQPGQLLMAAFFILVTTSIIQASADSVKCKKAEELRMQAVKEKKADEYKALNFVKQSITEAENCNDSVVLAHAEQLCGQIYDNLQLYSDALDHYFRALSIAEEKKMDDILSILYNHIGIIYSYQGNTQKSKEYFTKVVKEVEKTDDLLSMAKAYNNLGIAYKNLGEIDKAEEYYRQALLIFEQEKFEKGIVSCYANIGVIYFLRKDNKEALVWSQKVIDRAIRSENKFAEAVGRINHAEALVAENKYNEAITNYLKADQLAKETNNLMQQRDAMGGAYKLFALMGKYKEAFESLSRYIELKETLFSEETNQKLALSQKNYEMLKAEKELELSRKNEEITKKENEILKKNNEIEEQELHRTRILFVFVSLLCVAGIIMAIVMMKRFREKKRANLLLSEQKEKIQHQKKEITDSINYARRIQEAMLPGNEMFSKIFPQSFLFNRPKDIVSGDFYWIHPLYEGNAVTGAIYATADCTGHGVPGGFMSMLGNSFLNEIVNEKNITQPAEVLNQLRDKVIHALRQTGAEGENKDGMDITLVKIDFKTLRLSYAAAHNPVWIVREGDKGTKGQRDKESGNERESGDRKIIELKADKQPVAIYFRQKPFTQHDFQLLQGDTIITSTDGYADQFGGPKGKKYKKSKMKEMILSAGNFSELSDKIKTEFDAWSKHHEQNDDVLVIGIKI
ncbi:MAG: tetratricopeptide repeat protein [Bacteroidota bacterium]